MVAVDSAPEEESEGGEVTNAIKHEIYRAMTLLGAKSDLLSIVGSWGDTLPEDYVLDLLRGWNDATEAKVTK